MHTKFTVSSVRPLDNEFSDITDNYVRVQLYSEYHRRTVTLDVKAKDAAPYTVGAIILRFVPSIDAMRFIPVLALLLFSALNVHAADFHVINDSHKSALTQALDQAIADRAAAAADLATVLVASTHNANSEAK